MKKKIRIALLLGLSCVFAAGFAACEQTATDYTPLFEETERTELVLTYDEESGVLAWTELPAATKYVVSVAGRFAEPTVQEATSASLPLSLKAGDNAVSVAAEDANGTEVGFGAITVCLENDFGAPKKPENLVFDEQSNTLYWDASAGAVKYVVTGDRYDGEEGDFTAETTETGYLSSVVFEGGVYEYSVAGVGENGAIGAAAKLELRSYVDPDFNALLPDGTYNLIDFEDENSIALMRYSDHVEPSWLIWDPLTVVVPYSITTDGETPLKGEKFLKIVKESGAAAFGGVEIFFPEPVEIGTLYFDLMRTGGDGCGVMVKDENGNCATVIGMEWGTEGYEETANKWATFAYPLDHLRNSQFNFSKVKSITLYARAAKAGSFSIDNIRYDKTNVGLLGGSVEYESELNLLVWDSVPYAREYEIKIGDKTYVSRTNMVTTDALPVGAYEAEITAKNFDAARSATYRFEVKPVAPRSVSYDEQVFSYDAVSGAEYYYVRAVDANGKLRFEAETRKTQVKIVLPDGLYDISVCAVQKGVASEPAIFEYCSYVDENFKKELGDGTFRLLDFEDDSVLLSSAKSDYVEWGSSAPVSVAYSIVNGTNDFTHTSKALLLDNTSNTKASFGGATFVLPEAVRFGTFYVDICRFSGDGCGIMLEDEIGNRAPIFGLEWGKDGFEATASQFATLTITLSEVRTIVPAFSRVKKITFYVRAARGGKFMFDNVRIDEVNMGFFGEAEYEEADNRLVWDEVMNAKKYELTIDGKQITTYTNEFLADDEFGIGRHAVTIKAINGRMEREKSYAVEIGPPAPEASFDAATKTVSWNETFSAARYVVVLKNWNTRSTAFEKTVEELSVVLEGLDEGIYEILVYAQSADGVNSAACTLGYRTVFDEALGIGAALGDGKYKLFDFESASILAIARSSDYLPWQWNEKPTLANIPYKIEDGVLSINQETDGEMHFGGVEFSFENAVAINAFGFSHKRGKGDGAGVMIEDENGNKVDLWRYEWSEDLQSDYVKTLKNWVSYSFTIEQIREMQPSFGKLKSVTFYANASRSGEYLFDDVYYI